MSAQIKITPEKIKYIKNANGSVHTESWHKCPKCNEEKELNSGFGVRNMGDGTVRKQSHCRACRKRK